MKKIISYKSLSHVYVKSPVTTDWAFFMIFHVPRLISEQCFTTLFRLIE